VSAFEMPMRPLLSTLPLPSTRQFRDIKLPTNHVHENHDLLPRQELQSILEVFIRNRTSCVGDDQRDSINGCPDLVKITRSLSGKAALELLGCESYRRSSFCVRVLVGRCVVDSQRGHNCKLAFSVRQC
jgi:hypothetical protein